MEIRLHDGIPVNKNQKVCRVVSCDVYILRLIGKDAGGSHADHALNSQCAGGVENVGVDDEVVVGHVELSRHILEKAAHLEKA